MNYSRNVIAIGLAACLLWFPPAQAGASQQAQAAPDDPANWDNLQQLQPGQKVGVVQTNLAKHKGKFLFWTEEEITLRVKKQELTIPREEVHRVRRLGKNHTGSGAAIGAGIGAVVGLLIGRAQWCSGEPGFNVCAFVGLIIGTPVGAATGFNVGSGWRERTLVYQRGDESASPQAAYSMDLSADPALAENDSPPASTEVMLHLSKTLRPFTTERAMEVMASARVTNPLDENEDEALAARRRLYVAPVSSEHR